MSPDELNARIREKLDEIRRYQEQDLPDVIGTEAVNHFKESFANEGFTDETTTKWDDVKRRDPLSQWYGFAPDNKNRFSPTRAADKILTGDSKELQNSITYVKKSDRVSVFTDKVYAAVHQFGLQAKVFGKKAFTMTARPFMGRSKKLEENIHAKIKRDLERILFNR